MVAHPHPLRHTPAPRALLRGLAHALGLALVAAAAAFATDALGAGHRAGEFLVHLVPAALLLALVVAAWRHAIVGAFGFALLAAAYVATTPGRPAWWLAVAGPLALAALAHLASWWADARARRHGPTAEG